MPNYPNNTPWSDVTTTTRENRSAEHESLFTKAEKKGKKSPVHPITPKWNGKYPIRKARKRK